MFLLSGHQAIIVPFSCLGKIMDLVGNNGYSERGVISDALSFSFSAFRMNDLGGTKKLQPLLGFS